MNKRICANEECKREYELRRGKPGLINFCSTCGKEQEKGMVRLGGIMEYSCKTNPEIKLMPLDEAKVVIKATRRMNATSTLPSIVVGKN